MHLYGRILTGWDIQQNRWGWNRLWCLEMDCLLSESSFTCFTDKIQNNLVKPVKPLGIKGLFLTLISKPHSQNTQILIADVLRKAKVRFKMTTLHGSTGRFSTGQPLTSSSSSWTQQVRKADKLLSDSGYAFPVNNMSKMPYLLEYLKNVIRQWFNLWWMIHCG